MVDSNDTSLFLDDHKLSSKLKIYKMNYLPNELKIMIYDNLKLGGLLKMVPDAKYVEKRLLSDFAP